jgi:acetamidase/formamidase
MKLQFLVPVLATLAIGTFSAQAPRTHRLEATPATISYGYYWSEAKPVLRIVSGDIVDVDTLLTNTPRGLLRAGVPEEKIQPSLQAIVSEVTGDRRGPGGHILTGPIFVEGAEPGDALEVKASPSTFPSTTGTTGAAVSSRRTAIVLSR